MHVSECMRADVTPGKWMRLGPSLAGTSLAGASRGVRRTGRAGPGWTLPMSGRGAPGLYARALFSQSDNHLFVVEGMKLEIGDWVGLQRS